MHFLYHPLFVLFVPINKFFYSVYKFFHVLSFDSWYSWRNINFSYFILTYLLCIINLDYPLLYIIVFTDKGRIVLLKKVTDFHSFVAFPLFPWFNLSMTKRIKWACQVLLFFILFSLFLGCCRIIWALKRAWPMY